MTGANLINRLSEESTKKNKTEIEGISVKLLSQKQERDCWGVGFGGIWRGRRESVRKI